jgi:hypothetical protein
MGAFYQLTPPARNRADSVIIAAAAADRLRSR